ncbi:EAL domain-containing protein [Rheinheimera sp. UJ51]|uniref:EAL domain-containing protein n=1 Tax=Rheinheimera sp. UJ51 TaxID=2892446 RepID=UPI001E642B03|nr:EAL domain-containing protein [Rheinheimera sp. UJ51]MCC5452829.1 EAL domain-containing protein [Rheinheimera sp. UJ51]
MSTVNPPNESLQHEPIIADLIKRPLLTCAANDTLQTAAKLMRQHNVSCILIKEGDNISGIWSEADTRKLDFNQIDPTSITVGSLMSSPVISASELTSINGAASLMLNHNIRRLLVVNSAQQPVGLLTQSDIVRQQQIEFYLRFREVAGCIEKAPVFLDSTIPLAEAVQCLRQAKTDAAIVNFADQHQGLITERDLVQLLADGRNCQQVADIATKKLLVVPPNMSVLDAVTLLNPHNIRHLVVKEQQQILGLLSFNDILRNVEYSYIEQLKTALQDRDLALRTSADYLRLAHKVIDASMDGIMITDQHGFIQSVNPSFTKLTGYSQAEALGKTPRLLSSGLHPAEFYRHMWHTILETGHWQGEVWNKRKNGEIYPQSLSITAIRSESQQITQYAAIFSDITERKQQEEKIHQLAYIDELTGLANRRMFFDRLQLALANAQRHQHALAVLFLDLDLFKRINDTLGHHAGDQALKEVAKRLQNTLRVGESVARLGGDEFIILIPEIKVCDSLQALAQRLIAQFERPVQLLGQDFFLTTSIGISLFPKDGHTAEMLVKHADVAMYQAKNAGRNQYRFYDASQGQQNVDELKLEQALRQALRLQLLEVHYQPKFSIKTQEVIGFEALLRWSDPELGPLSPALFIPLAEKLGLIHQLGEWVLRQVCFQLKQWQASALPVSINISVLQLMELDFLPRFRAIVTQAAIQPRLIELELTESCFIPEHSAYILNVLTELKKLGLRLSIDDFGTGYSSLSYLRRLPIDALKIDHSFIRELPANESDRQITLAIIAMAKALGLEVIAEGIEHTAQCEFLLQAGCDTGQGYFISPALPAADITKKWLKTTPSTSAEHDTV